VIALCAALEPGELLLAEPRLARALLKPAIERGHALFELRPLGTQRLGLRRVRLLLELRVDLRHALSGLARFLHGRGEEPVDLAAHRVLDAGQHRDAGAVEGDGLRPGHGPEQEQREPPHAITARGWWSPSTAYGSTLRKSRSSAA
jgi:hypothetical protein